MVTVLNSKLDASVNHVDHYGKSFIESRFVQREKDQTIIYLSSQNGCKMACRFCHLTQTGQTEMLDVNPQLFAQQFEAAIKGHDVTKRLNVNFMARGEPLENKFIVNNWKDIKANLRQSIEKWSNGDRELHENIFDSRFPSLKYNLSTIVPSSVNKTAVEIFGKHALGPENIYWSLYSVDPKFRKKWMPRAHSLDKCLKFLEGFPSSRIVIHMAFIEGENDSIQDIRNLRSFLKDSFEGRNMPRINIVRYNSANDKTGVESDAIDEIADGLRVLTKVNIVPRVGVDVMASCGTFYS